VKLVHRSLLATLLFGASLDAFAALGGGLETVHADAAQLQASDVTSTSGSLTVHSLQRGTVVLAREFTDQSGKVVGVAWSGQSKPNLSLILGASYFPRMAESRSKGITSHRVMVLHDEDFVIESQGSMHTGFSGRAYLTSAISAGVTPELFK
jgi:hypothetical protein